jgi:hypothetical protein
LKRAVLQVLVLEIILWVEGSRSSDKAYAGKVAMFGELVLGVFEARSKSNCTLGTGYLVVAKSW